MADAARSVPTLYNICVNLLYLSHQWPIVVKHSTLNVPKILFKVLLVLFCQRGGTDYTDSDGGIRA